MSEFVYFIVGKPDGYRKDEFAVKIGLSDNVRETRMGIEEAGWTDLKTYAIYSGKGVARVVEQSAKKFELTSLRRGWFRVKREDLDAYLKTLDDDADLSYWQECKAFVGKRAKQPAAEDGGARLPPTPNAQKPTKDDGKPAKDDVKSAKSDKKSTKDDRKTARDDEQSVVDGKPAKAERKPRAVADDTKPAKDERKSAKEDIKSTKYDKKADVDDKKATKEERKPRAPRAAKDDDNVKSDKPPNNDGRKPSAAKDDKPRVKDDKPASAPKEGRSRTTRPSDTRDSGGRDLPPLSDRDLEWDS